MSGTKNGGGSHEGPWTGSISLPFSLPKAYGSAINLSETLTTPLVVKRQVEASGENKESHAFVSENSRHNMA